MEKLLNLFSNEKKNGMPQQERHSTERTRSVPESVIAKRIFCYVNFLQSYSIVRDSRVPDSEIPEDLLKIISKVASEACHMGSYLYGEESDVSEAVNVMRHVVRLIFRLPVVNPGKIGDEVGKLSLRALDAKSVTMQDLPCGEPYRPFMHNLALLVFHLQASMHPNIPETVLALLCSPSCVLDPFDPRKNFDSQIVLDDLKRLFESLFLDFPQIGFYSEPIQKMFLANFLADIAPAGLVLTLILRYLMVFKSIEENSNITDDERPHYTRLVVAALFFYSIQRLYKEKNWKYPSTEPGSYERDVGYFIRCMDFSCIARFAEITEKNLGRFQSDVLQFRGKKDEAEITEKNPGRIKIKLPSFGIKKNVATHEYDL